MFSQDPTAALGAATAARRVQAAFVTAQRILELPSPSGRALGADLFEPSGKARAQLVVHGATATPARFYRGLATHLADRGVRVLTYDYRGIGRSRAGSMADDPVQMHDWIDDAAFAQRWLQRLSPSLPVLALGHSFGGQIAPALCPDAPARAVITVGAQSGYLGRFPWPRRAQYWLQLHAALPALLHGFGYLPGWSGIGEDLPAGVATQWARWCDDEEYFLSELPWLRPRLASFGGPVLALSFTDDALAPLGNVRWLQRQLASATIHARHLRPADLGRRHVGHFGFFRPSARAGWDLVASFIDHVVDGRGDWAPPTLDELAVLADLQYGREAA